MLEALHLDVFATTLAGFFAIMNPLANTPVFLGLTEGLSAHARRRVATQAVLIAFIVIAVFSVLGQAVFALFGITVAAFRVAGGIIVFLIGYQMLQGRSSKVHHTAAARAAGRVGGGPVEGGADEGRGSRPSAGAPKQASEDTLAIAVSPLGVPLLAGPGTIATAIGFAGGQWDKAGVTLAAFAVLCLGTWASFAAAERIMTFVGRPMLTVLTRLMGLILSVIGVQMFFDGYRAILP